jgi:hypothetical protein
MTWSAQMVFVRGIPRSTTVCLIRIDAVAGTTNTRSRRARTAHVGQGHDAQIIGHRLNQQRRADAIGELMADYRLEATGVDNDLVKPMTGQMTLT